LKGNSVLRSLLGQCRKVIIICMSRINLITNNFLNTIKQRCLNSRFSKVIGFEIPIASGINDQTRYNKMYNKFGLTYEKYNFCKDFFLVSHESFNMGIFFWCLRSRCWTLYWVLRYSRTLLYKLTSLSLRNFRVDDIQINLKKRCAFLFMKVF
jgi:hypothetical protein